jgi:hypothetical protein
LSRASGDERHVPGLGAPFIADGLPIADRMQSWRARVEIWDVGMCVFGSVLQNNLPVDLSTTAKKTIQ